MEFVVGDKVEMIENANGQSIGDRGTVATESSAEEEWGGQFLEVKWDSNGSVSGCYSKRLKKVRFQSRYTAEDFEVGETVLAVPGTKCLAFPNDSDRQLEDWDPLVIANTPSVGIAVNALRPENYKARTQGHAYQGPLFALNTADLVKVTDRVKINLPGDLTHGLIGTRTGWSSFGGYILVDADTGRKDIHLREEELIVLPVKGTETEEPLAEWEKELLRPNSTDLIKPKWSEVSVDDKVTIKYLPTEEQFTSKVHTGEYSGLSVLGWTFSEGENDPFDDIELLSVEKAPKPEPEKPAPGTAGTASVNGTRIHGMIDADGDFTFLEYDSYDEEVGTEYTSSFEDFQPDV